MRALCENTCRVERRRAALLVAGAALSTLLLPLSRAGAVDIGGVSLPDSLRLTPDGPLLTLNGAGERRMLLFRIYAIGLYLSQRARTMEEALAQDGPKRMLLVMLRDNITAKQVHDHVLARLGDQTQPDEMAVMKARIDELDHIIQAEASIDRGGTIALDYIPKQGTVIRVNGITKGQPIAGEDFYRALLRIWLGPGARSATLREALLGRAG